MAIIFAPRWDQTFRGMQMVSGVLRYVGIVSLMLLAACRPSPDHFFLAAKQGKVDQINRLLDRGLSITVLDREGQTALHVAARWGRESVASVLLDRGAPIDATDHEGRTPLHLAAKENQEPISQLLIERGAQPDAPDHYGSTPLHVAAEWNAGDVARVLIARGANLHVRDMEGSTPLHVAAAWGADMVAVILLDTGAMVNAVGSEGQTPLHLTAKGTRRLYDTAKEQLAIARLLLDRGASLEAVRKDGGTPLHVAAQGGDIELARLLIERGAAMEALSTDGLTPLGKAVMHNQTTIARLLLERGARLDIPDNRGKVSLHLAAELGQASMVRLLLEKRASVVAVDDEGRTPLHEPAARGHEGVVRLLLDGGAAVESRDHKHWTPLHLATFHGREAIVQLLLDRGAQVNSADAQGVTPLHGATFYGFEGIRQLLIRRGATIDLVDDRGFTAAQYAKRQGISDSIGDSSANGTVPSAAAAQKGIPRLHLPLIKIDGSSTVYPLSQLAAERYWDTIDKAVRVSVGISGTGGGFQKFCRGEIDIQDASRPITLSELDLCRTNGIQFAELPVAYDALSVVVSASNQWVESLTLKELKAMWEPAAHMKVTSWDQIRRDWPGIPLKLFGAGPDSGSFDYFTEAVVGRAKASRADYTGSEDDNVLVDGVAESRLALGYIPFAYLEPNRRRLKAVAIDAGNGPVLPSKDTVVAGQYQPLSRPIFIYVNQRSAVDSAVRQFVEYYLTQAPELIEQVGYVAFRREAYPSILEQFQKGRLGTSFEGKSPIGMTIEHLLALQSKM
jgi:phosphate transport system substrate-binding protein